VVEAVVEPGMTDQVGERPRQDSNLRHRLRRAVLYPLSYEGKGIDRSAPGPASSQDEVAR
jgi:hypothetical protein